MTSDPNHLHPKSLMFEENGNIPNSELQVLIYQNAAHHDDLEKIFRQCFQAHGWSGIWVDGIFNYHHFHSNAHEVLGVAEGVATVMLGGEDGAILHIRAGDVLVLPAGTGHKCISASKNFAVIGAYPEGQEDYDIQTNSADVPNYRIGLRAVKTPPQDPLFGADGSLMRLWAYVEALADETHNPIDKWPV